MNVAHYTNVIPLKSAASTDPGLLAVPPLCQLEPLHGLLLLLETLFPNTFTSFQVLLKCHLPWSLPWPPYFLLGPPSCFGFFIKFRLTFIQHLLVCIWLHSIPAPSRARVLAVLSPGHPTAPTRAVPGTQQAPRMFASWTDPATLCRRCSSALNLCCLVSLFRPWQC